MVGVHTRKNRYVERKREKENVCERERVRERESNVNGNRERCVERESKNISRIYGRAKR